VSPRVRTIDRSYPTVIVPIVWSVHTVDAAYEGVQKRTFLAMAVMTFLLAPFLVILILLYPKLGKLRDKQIAAASSLGTEPNNDKDSTEFSQLMPETDTKLLINCPKSHVLGDSRRKYTHALLYKNGMTSRYYISFKCHVMIVCGDYTSCRNA